MLLIGSAVLAVSCAILMLADNTGLIILGRLIAGAAAAWWVIQSATYAHYHEDETQVKAQGVIAASANWGKMAAALVSGLAAQFLGIRSIFTFSFFIAIAGVFLIIGIKDIPQKKPDAAVASKNTSKQIMKDLLPLFRNRDLMVFSLLAILSNILCFCGAHTVYIRGRQVPGRFQPGPGDA